MTAVLAAGHHYPPGHTALDLSAAVIVVVLVIGYPMWPDRHGARGKQNSHRTEEATSWHR
jgi:hypothetical protein